MYNYYKYVIIFEWKSKIWSDYKNEKAYMQLLSLSYNFDRLKSKNWFIQKIKIVYLNYNYYKHITIDISAFFHIISIFKQADIHYNFE